MYGNSIISPGVLHECKTFKASCAITFCCNLLFGSPIGLPKGNFTCTVLGGFTTPAISLYIIIITVGIPKASISLAISPPDLLQTGQVEVKTTASTLSAFRFCATSFAVVSVSKSGFWIYPINE